MLKLRLLLLLLVPVLLLADNINGGILAKKLHLSAGTKAIIQWERIFTSNRKKRKYKINTLTLDEQNSLKEYLIQHAIDSDHPMVAGE
jgi:hypothetical protein